MSDEFSRYSGSDMVQESARLTRVDTGIDFEVPAADENDPSDYQYRIEAQVTDASRRTIDGSGSFAATGQNCGACSP